MGVVGIRISVAFVKPEKGIMVDVNKNGNGEKTERYRQFVCLPGFLSYG